MLSTGELNQLWKIFFAGIIFVGIVVGAVQWIDTKVQTAPYYPKDKGAALEQRLETYETRNDARLDVIENQQRQLIEGVGRIEGKIDSLKR